MGEAREGGAVPSHSCLHEQLSSLVPLSLPPSLPFCLLPFLPPSLPVSLPFLPPFLPVSLCMCLRLNLNFHLGRKFLKVLMEAAEESLVSVSDLHLVSKDSGQDVEGSAVVFVPPEIATDRF